MDNQKIISMTNNRTTYLKGVDYYNRGKVEIIYFDKNHLNEMGSIEYEKHSFDKLDTLLKNIK